MTIVVDARHYPQSPYIEMISSGRTTSIGTLTRPAETHWHIVLSKRPEKTELLLVGPWSTSGTVSFGADGEVLWIRFKMGVYMPHMLTRRLLNQETPLPAASGGKFWLQGTAWQLPDYNNADVFIEHLVRQELLTIDPLVAATLNGEPLDTSARTLRHRFLQTTGSSQNHIFQVKRAWQAEALLRQGTPILDVVQALGFYDQPHLTHALRRYIGYTPTEILGYAAPLAVSYKTKTPKQHYAIDC